MKHLDVRHCRLLEELKSGNHKVKRVDRRFNASDTRTHSPSPKELRKVPSHEGLPHNDGEEGKLQCRQDDAERDACSEGDCISLRVGRKR